MTKTEWETVRIEVASGVGYLVLNRPERLNAINNDLIEEAQLALDALEHDDGVRVIVVKGAGRSFCAGYDLAARDDGKPFYSTMHEEWEWINWQARQWERLWRMRKPTIAQVHGYCYAGGVSIMGFCDIVMAADDCLIGQPEVRAQGFAPDVGLWHYTIGPRKTKELLFTGNAVTGTQAEKMGMVNYARPQEELDAFTREFAERVAHMPPDMLAYAKRLVNQQFDIQGLYSSIMAGVNFDFMAHRSEARVKFAEVAAEHGIKRAVEARDAPFGGTQRIPKRPGPQR